MQHGAVRLGKGSENVKGYLKGNPEWCEEIRHAGLVKRGLIPGDDQPDAASGDGKAGSEKTNKRREAVAAAAAAGSSNGRAARRARR